MTDREKVLKGLQHCTAWNGLYECHPKVGDDCPYVGEANCKLTIMLDALKLLKEQEPKLVPVVKSENDGLIYGRCPRCGKIMDKQRYCGNCGQAVVHVSPYGQKPDQDFGKR